MLQTHHQQSPREVMSCHFPTAGPNSQRGLLNETFSSTLPPPQKQTRHPARQLPARPHQRKQTPGRRQTKRTPKKQASIGPRKCGMTLRSQLDNTNAAKHFVYVGRWPARHCSSKSQARLIEETRASMRPKQTQMAPQSEQESKICAGVTKAG